MVQQVTNLDPLGDLIDAYYAVSIYPSHQSNHPIAYPSSEHSQVANYPCP